MKYYLPLFLSVLSLYAEQAPQPSSAPAIEELHEIPVPPPPPQAKDYTAQNWAFAGGAAAAAAIGIVLVIINQGESAHAPIP